MTDNATAATIKTTTLEEALRTGQQAGYQYVHIPGANNCYIEDFVEELSLSEDEGFTDYIRVNNTVFRLSDAWHDDAELFELN